MTHPRERRLTENLQEAGVDFNSHGRLSLSDAYALLQEAFLQDVRSALSKNRGKPKGKSWTAFGSANLNATWPDGTKLESGINKWFFLWFKLTDAAGKETQGRFDVSRKAPFEAAREIEGTT